MWRSQPQTIGTQEALEYSLASHKLGDNINDSYARLLHRRDVTTNEKLLPGRVQLMLHWRTHDLVTRAVAFSGTS